jgi:hypothetical protein
MPLQPAIAFCTTCKGRLQHLERTLPQNIADNTGYENLKFIVLDYNSQDGLADWMSQQCATEIQNGRVAFYRFLEPTPFRMAHAKNLAHRLGILESADILVNLDADNFTGEGFATFIAEKFQDSATYLVARRNPPGYGGDLLPKGINGRTVVSRKAFLKAGGYDEAKFDAWGPDDKDFNIRLRRLGYVPQQIERRFLETGAILHNDKMRFREYPHAQNDNEAGSIEEEATIGTIANFGHFGEGIVFKNWNWKNPITLAPMPTRIFGIGMHKTATTSLNAALTILGYEAAHWKSAHWAKAIWDEMHDTGRSLTLEKSYALSDLPITLLYRELDVAYPGSKFILTVRDEDAWLSSVRNHWDHELNPFRRAWDHDPFTHQVHKELYGRRDFDAAIFLARYRQHNAEVREYFKDRPGDLLIMDMDSRPRSTLALGIISQLPSAEMDWGYRRDGWPELCGFLSQPVPSQPYPHRFKTGEKTE